MTKMMLCIIVILTLSFVLKSEGLVCQIGGDPACAAYCLRIGRPGGCCGVSVSKCNNICYCYESGLEHRCYRCDI